MGEPEVSWHALANQAPAHGPRGPTALAPTRPTTDTDKKGKSRSNAHLAVGLIFRVK